MRFNNLFGGKLAKYLILVIAFCFITFYQAILTLILCVRFQVFLLFIDIILFCESEVSVPATLSPLPLFSPPAHSNMNNQFPS